MQAALSRGVQHSSALARLSTLALLQRMLAALHAALADADAAAAAAEALAAADAAAAAAACRSGSGGGVASCGDAPKEPVSVVCAGISNSSDASTAGVPLPGCFTQADELGDSDPGIMVEDGGLDAAAEMYTAGGHADLAGADAMDLDDSGVLGRGVDSNGIGRPAAGGAVPTGAVQGGGADWRAFAARLRGAARARLPDPQARSLQPSQYC